MGKTEENVWGRGGVGRTETSLYQRAIKSKSFEKERKSV
jgi:hypothetical protein